MKNLKFKYKVRIIGLIMILITLNLGINIVSGEKIGLENINNVGVEYSNIKINSSSDQDYIFVYVKSGDTIWSIVQENYEHISKPKYMNFSSVVNFVINLNGGCDLKIGQTIKIPKNI